jgi:hypothetical protein
MLRTQVSPTAPSATGNSVANAVAIGNALAYATAFRSVAIGYVAQISGDYSVSIGTNNIVAGNYAVGIAGSAGSHNSTAIGTNSANSHAVTATGTGAMALGGSYASGSNSFAAAIANHTSSYGATGANSVAMGPTAKATGAGAFSIGKNSFASGGDSGIFGVQSIANSTRSYAFGAYANAGHEGKIAFSNQRLASAGDTQAGLIVLRIQTTSDTPAALTTSSGGTPTTQQVILPNNSAYAFHGTIVARQQASQGTACAAWKVEGLDPQGRLGRHDCAGQQRHDCAGQHTRLGHGSQRRHDQWWPCYHCHRCCGDEHSMGSKYKYIRSNLLKPQRRIQYGYSN